MAVRRRTPTPTVGRRQVSYHHNLPWGLFFILLCVVGALAYVIGRERGKQVIELHLEEHPAVYQTPWSRGA